MQKSTIRPQIFAALSASLIMICCGFHFAWPNATTPEMINKKEYFPIASLLTIGGTVGLLLGLFSVDKFGRKTTLLSVTPPLVTSCIVLTIAQSFRWLCLARFLAGLGVGVALTVTPMYIGEIADSRIRGGLCVLIPVMLKIGELIPFATGLFANVHVLGIIGATITIVFATALSLAPESPYHYAMKENRNEVEKSLAWLRGTPDVVEEVQEIFSSMTPGETSVRKLMGLVELKSNRKAFLVIIGLLTCQYLSGYAVYLDHYTQLMAAVIPENYHHLTSVIKILIELVTSIFVVFLADRIGRRPLLLGSVSLCVFFSLSAALNTQLVPNGGDNPAARRLVVIIGYLISYSIGLGTLPYVVRAEIFSCEVKALALAICTMYSYTDIDGIEWLWQWIMSIGSGHVVFCLLAAFNIVSAIFVYFVVPETKGLSLSEIQTRLREPLPIRL